MTAPLRVILLQPAPGGLISGGYRYNLALGNELDNAGLGQLVSWDPANPCRLPRADIVLLDSLYLASAPSQQAIEILRATGAELHLLAHCFVPANPMLSAPDIERWEHSARAWLEHCQAAITTGHRMQRPWSSWLGPGVPVRVATPAVPSLPRSDRRFTEGDDSAVRILSVGALTASKNQQMLLEHIAQHKRRNVHWQLIGSTELDRQYAVRFAQTVRSNDLERRVSVCGTRPHPAVLDALRETDLFVSTSVFETFGMAAAEALAVGVPTLAFDVGDIRTWSTGPSPVRLHAVGDEHGFLESFDEFTRDPRSLHAPAQSPCFEAREWRETLGIILDSLNIPFRA